MGDALWTTTDYLRQGGWIMVPLAICSVAMWALIIDRLRVFTSLGRDDLDVPEAVAALRAGQAAGRQSEDASGSTSGRRGGLRRSLVVDFLSRRSGRTRPDRDQLRLCTRRLQGGLRKHLAAIAVLAAVAPLLGLLGTVLGMIQTFDVISLFGTGNARAMAGGISVALVTTQTGLLVAIPGLFASVALSRRAKRLSLGLEELATVLDRQIRGLPATKGGAT